MDIKTSSTSVIRIYDTESIYHKDKENESEGSLNTMN